jgi:hypothetical protein
MKTVEQYAAPEWDAWLYAPEIDTLDAVCLSMNICPQEAHEDYGIVDAMRGDEDEGLGGPRIADIEAAVTFQKRLFATRHYGKRLKLVEFVNFARKLGWEMPAQLAQLATLQPPAKVAEPASDESSRIAAPPRDAERSAAEAATKTGATPFGPIENETRSHVDTACAAFWLNRKEQTLRAWASKENGPIRPIKVNGRNAWAVADIRRILSKR